MRSFVGSAYLQSFLFSGKEDIEKHLLSPFDVVSKNVEFDTIVCTGISGIVAGSILSNEFNKKLIIVRKSREETHSGYKLEGAVGKKYLFVDDFIASGTTVNYINGVLDLSLKVKLSGVFLYNDYGLERDSSKIEVITKYNSKMKIFSYHRDFPDNVIQIDCK